MMKSCLHILFFFCAALVCLSHVRADWTDEIKSLIDSHDGQVAVSIKNLKTGTSFSHRGDAVQATASLIKLPVLIELYRQAEAGKLSLEKMIDIQETDKVPGSGVITDHIPAGSKIPLRGIAQLMIAFSDNTATNLVIEQTGLVNVNSMMENLGLKETRLNSKVYRRDTTVAPDRSEKFGLGSTTANETMKLMELLYARQLVSPAASDQMLKHLATCDDATKIRRFIPKSVKTYNKTGAVANTRTDACILDIKEAPVAIVVLTTMNRDASWGTENAAEILCGKIGQIVYQEFSPKKSDDASAERKLTVGATGEMVEALQRALNQKVRLDVALSIDGDFGPMTATAVRNFQAANGLEATGIVDEKTWKLLGPLQFQEDVIPAPETVNARIVERQPADPLDGKPFVSCKAWLVADGETGSVIGSDKLNEQLDIASTTKIMTAWLVCQECERNPMVLNERITFSKRADDTIGSSATVRAGESMTVQDALYGLMLPSGNDMAVAFAEHFGTRCSDSKDSGRDALELFVEAMNREAEKLGMKNTQYKNPHGLTAKGHYSSCYDLLILAKTALQSELLRKVINTSQHGCTLTSQFGYTRNVVWKNTNTLLGIEGYFGMKTGTTDAAGACLVSCSRRDERLLIVVVLGASGSAARYSDSRNLHRWGWQERAKLNQ